jgi:hypothetical protein
VSNTLDGFRGQAGGMDSFQKDVTPSIAGRNNQETKRRHHLISNLILGNTE